jgi:hypothetical protein
MSQSESQLKHLSPEDRIVYMQWLRRGLLFHGTLLALLIFAAFANHSFRGMPGEVAGGKVQIAATTAQR